MKAQLALFGLLVICSVSANATTQIPDQIVLDGHEWPLLNDPVAALYVGMERNLELMSKVPKPTCSANWRGYKAYWKIDDSRLFLLRVVTNPCSGSTTELPIDVIVPGESAPVLASWYSGTLTIGVGKPLRKGGLDPEYDRYLILRVDHGVVLTSAENSPSTPLR